MSKKCDNSFVFTGTRKLVIVNRKAQGYEIDYDGPKTHPLTPYPPPTKESDEGRLTPGDDEFDYSSIRV